MFDQECSLIIVEDEPLVAMGIEGMVEELGCTVEGVAGSEEEALALLNKLLPRAALLDINLHGITSLQVATRCREKGIPFIFITGYQASDLPDGFADVEVLSKPIQPDDLAGALRRALDLPGEPLPPAAEPRH